MCIVTMQERKAEPDALHDRLTEMESDALADQHTIDELRLAVVANQKTIAALQAEGAIDRLEIANLRTALESARRIGTSTPDSTSAVRRESVKVASPHRVGG